MSTNKLTKQRKSKRPQGSNNLEFSVVIPVFNEEGNIGSLLLEVRAALNGKRTFEIIVVDDGSTDQTWPLLKDYCKDLLELNIIQHPRKFGQSIALITGVKAARAPWILTLDGDGQNDPADIERLLIKVAEPTRAGHFLIIGNRSKRHDSWLRIFSSRIANNVRQALLHDECPDSGCGLKVFERKAFLDLPKFDHMHRFLPALFKRAGGTVINIEVSHRPRIYGVSKYGVFNRFWVGVIDLFGVIWLQRRPCQPELGDERE